MYGVEPRPPKFLPTLSVAVLRRLGFRPMPKFSRVNRPDVSEDGTCVLPSVEGASPASRNWGWPLA